MDSLYGETEESAEDSQGRKKSKLKSLKTRLFGRSKRGGEEGDANFSQSASDITAGEGLGSDEDLACSPVTMGSRALSHDSIFLADQVLTDAEPARILSQENVHSKIKTLQMKLQQQKMHLGPPPLVRPVRRPEDLESRSEDDRLLHTPAETTRDVTTHGKMLSQPFSLPLLPTLKPAPIKSVAQTTTNPLPVFVFNSSVVETPLDFSSPAQFTPCLNNSAARHRMFVKPKNQRASTKRRLAATDSGSHLQPPNNIDPAESVKEEELRAQEKVTKEAEQGGAVICCTSECPLSKSPEAVLITPEETSTLSILSFSKQDPDPPGREASVPPQVLRVKPQRPAVVISRVRPQSSIIPSGLTDKREEGFEKPVMSHDKIYALNKIAVTQFSSKQLSTSCSSLLEIKSSPVHQKIQIKTESTKGIKRPAQGSGSFHFSITTAKKRDGERPQSGSFVGVLEQTEARQRMEDKPFSSMKEKVEHKELPPKGGPIAVGVLDKSSVIPSDRDSFKKVESVASSKNTNTSAAELENRQEVEQQEVVEDEGKTAFGIKLRPTSQSMRVQANASSYHNARPPGSEKLSDKQKGKEITDNTNDMCKKLSTNMSITLSTTGDLRPKDPASSDFPLVVKHTPPLTCDPLLVSNELQTTAPNPKEVETALAKPQDPKPAPQRAPSEVSWMSLAREKTKSLQQLITSRFPMEFSGMQAAARPQAQVQTSNELETKTGTQLHTQTVKIQQSKTPEHAANQPSNDEVQAETVQSRSQTQTVKPSLMAEQQKAPGTSPAQTNSSRETQTSKQTSEPQSHPSTTPSASQPASAQTNPPTTQSPVPSAQAATSQFAQGNATQSFAQSYLSLSQQQTPRSNRSLHPVLKSSTSSPAPVSTTSSATAPPSVSALGRMEGEARVQEKEGISVLGRQAVWTGSVSQKTAFLERRAEWTTPPVTKGVEMKKDQTDTQTSGESSASAKTAAPIKDTKPEGRQGMKPADSSPIRVPDRLCDDKWLRINVPSPSSPKIPSTLPSMSHSGQPSWMELARRKSMAWGDKSMD